MKRIYQGKPFEINGEIWKVEFLTTSWVLLGSKRRAALFHIDDVLQEKFNLTTGIKMVERYKDQQDLSSVITAYENLSKGNPNFADTSSSGFYNLKYFNSLAGFLEYSYKETTRREVLNTAIESSELLYASLHNPTYQWMSMSVSDILNAFSSQEKSTDTVACKKYLANYIKLRTICQWTKDNADMTELTFGVRPLNLICPDKTSFNQRFPGVRIIDLVDDEVEPYWGLTKDGTVVSLHTNDYESGVSTIKIGRSDGV